MAQHNDIGRKGEEVTADLMKKKGFRVLHTNWKFGHLEMDVIAANKDVIAFVEVKTRTSDYGNKRPEEYVDILKRHRMAAAASAYIKMYQITQQPRFDVVGILMDSDTMEVKEISHIEDAFTPPTKTIHSGTYNGQGTWKHRRRIIGK